MNFEYKEYFPFEQVRAEQDTAINFILDAFLNQNKEFVILQAPTGCGKSAIAITVAKYLQSLCPENSSYILTTQKILQEQYIRDFTKDGLVNIKSSDNYTCDFDKNNSCGGSLRLLKFENKYTDFFKFCSTKCAYKQAKQKFLDANYSITNYSYFLAETMYSGQIKPRNLLIMDEVHNVNENLSSFTEIVINEQFVNEKLKIEVPELKTDLQVYKWLAGDYKLALIAHIESIKRKIQFVANKASLVEYHEKLDKHICKLNRFVDSYKDNRDNWVLNKEEKNNLQTFQFKPIDVSNDAEPLLFKYGKLKLMMSATIVDCDLFCKTLGIDTNKVAYLSTESPFLIANRPIFYINIAEMNKRTIQKSLPKILDGVREIAKMHNKDKGLIHAHSYLITNYIRDNLKTSRLITHDRYNRELALKKHIASTEPTMLLTPSMTEGIDLSDDLSRFQIICKVPYPSLGDKVWRKKIRRNKTLYQCETIKTIIQSIGRSIRNSDDYCVTYIIDSDFSKLYDKYKHLFPEWFHKALMII